MIITDELSKRPDDFKSLCSIYKVNYLYAFGSSVTGQFDYEKSDIDLPVEIDDNDP